VHWAADGQYWVELLQKDQRSYMTSGTGYALTEHAALLPPHLCDVGVAHYQVTQTCEEQQQQQQQQRKHSQEGFATPDAALPAAAAADK
jgi:hypothetical protein